jgi:hypothetical protein
MGFHEIGLGLSAPSWLVTLGKSHTNKTGATPPCPVLSSHTGDICTYLDDEYLMCVWQRVWL